MHTDPDTNPTSGPLLLAHTPDEVAAALRVPRRQIVDAIRRGELGSIRVGKHIRCTVAQVSAYVDSLTAESHAGIPA
jgi:excisionase family DNA binding protein